MTTVQPHGSNEQERRRAARSLLVEKLRPPPDGSSCKSNAVVLTAFCSSPVSRARLSVNVSAIRNSIRTLETPFRADHVAGPRRQRREGDPVLFVGLLHAGHLQVLQDHLWERRLFAVADAALLGGLGDRVDQLGPVLANVTLLAK